MGLERHKEYCFNALPPSFRSSTDPVIGALPEFLITDDELVRFPSKKVLLQQIWFCRFFSAERIFIKDKYHQVQILLDYVMHLQKY